MTENLQRLTYWYSCPKEKEIICYVPQRKTIIFADGYEADLLSSRINAAFGLGRCLADSPSGMYQSDVDGGGERMRRRKAFNVALRSAFCIGTREHRGSLQFLTALCYIG